MSTTAQNLIEAAYARSTSNDAGKLATDGELLVYLNRRYQSMYAQLAIVAPENYLASSTLAFVGTPAVATLPTDIIDIVRIEDASGVRQNLIPVAEKDRVTWHLAPAMYRKGNSIVSRGNGGDPANGASLTMFYLDAPATLSALATALDTRFPVRFEDVLILDLAIYLSVKDTNRDAKEFSALKDEYTEVVKSFVALLKNANTAKASVNPANNAPGSAS